MNSHVLSLRSKFDTVQKLPVECVKLVQEVYLSVFTNSKVFELKRHFEIVLLACLSSELRMGLAVREGVRAHAQGVLYEELKNLSHEMSKSQPRRS